MKQNKVFTLKKNAQALSITALFCVFIGAQACAKPETAESSESTTTEVLLVTQFKVVLIDL